MSGALAGMALVGTWALGSAAGAAERPGSATGAVGVTLTGSGGCRGAGTSLDSNGHLLSAATAPGGSGASSAHPLVVDRNGTVPWHGSTATVITNHHWWVHVDGFPIKSGGSANASHSTSASGVEHVSTYLPSWLGLTGVFYVNGQISGTGGACTGAIYVQINGDPATGALFYIALVFVLAGGALIFFGLPTRLASGTGADAVPRPETDEAPE
jgi:hypothetical protein